MEKGECRSRSDWGEHWPGWWEWEQRTWPPLAAKSTSNSLSLGYWGQILNMPSQSHRTRFLWWCEILGSYFASVVTRPISLVTRPLRQSPSLIHFSPTLDFICRRCGDFLDSLREEDTIGDVLQNTGSNSLWELAELAIPREYWRNWSQGFVARMCTGRSLLLVPYHTPAGPTAPFMYLTSQGFYEVAQTDRITTQLMDPVRRKDIT